MYSSSHTLVREVEKLMGLVLAAAVSSVLVYLGARWGAALLLDQRSARFRLVIALMVTILLVGGGTWLAWATTYRNDHIATCKVTKTDRGATDGGYRVYTSNCGQLANEDSFLRWKQNSADLWEQIPANGGTCTFRIAGSRWPWFDSQMPNIFKVIKCTSTGAA